jgi:hypothetical protein
MNGHTYVKLKKKKIRRTEYASTNFVPKVVELG